MFVGTKVYDFFKFWVFKILKVNLIEELRVLNDLKSLDFDEIKSNNFGLFLPFRKNFIACRQKLFSKIAPLESKRKSTKHKIPFILRGLGLPTKTSLINYSKKKEDTKSSCYWLSKLYDNAIVLAAGTPVLPMHRDKQFNTGFTVLAAHATKS